jgi:hypothetical protein
MQGTCWNCAWYEPTGEDGLSGFCHKNPPYIEGFPRVSSDDFCALWDKADTEFGDEA